MPATRVMILDDHALFRDSLSRFLASEPEVEFVGGYGGTVEALDRLKASQVDLVLLDFDLGSELGTLFLREVRKEGFTGKVLMVTAGMNTLETAAALESGASGIFLKHSPPAALLDAIRVVRDGGIWIDPKISQISHGRRPKMEKSISRPLTHREQQVLRSVFEGHTNKEIGDQLGVSEAAIKATLQQLFEKTGVRTRAQLVRVALETSLDQ